MSCRLGPGFRRSFARLRRLYAGAGTPGERDAAEAALGRLRARLAKQQASEPPVEIQFSLGDEWSRRLFLALCRRYGLDPYRYKRQRRTTVVVRLPQSFCNEVLWPEFEALDKELRRYLNSVTSKLIKDEVYADTREAAEVDVARLSAG